MASSWVFQVCRHRLWYQKAPDRLSRWQLVSKLSHWTEKIPSLNCWDHKVGNYEVRWSSIDAFAGEDNVTRARMGGFGGGFTPPYRRDCIQLVGRKFDVLYNHLRNEYCPFTTYGLPYYGFLTESSHTDH